MPLGKLSYFQSKGCQSTVRSVPCFQFELLTRFGHVLHAEKRDTELRVCARWRRAGSNSNLICVPSLSELALFRKDLRRAQSDISGMAVGGGHETCIVLHLLQTCSSQIQPCAPRLWLQPCRH